MNHYFKLRLSPLLSYVSFLMQRNASKTKHSLPEKSKASVFSEKKAIALESNNVRYL